MRVRLTKTAIDAARYGGKEYDLGGWSRFVLWDSQLPGFGLRVWPSGRKAFILHYRRHGRSRLITIGDSGSITLSQARFKAQEMRGTIHLSGDDPLDSRESERRRAKTSTLCRHYLERHAKVHKRSWKDDERRVQRYILPALGSKQLLAVSRNDVAELHRRIGKKAPYEANRTLEVISKMFDLACDWGFIDEGHPNPGKRIKKFTEKKRDRWVSASELPKLIQAIEEEDSIYVRSALWLYLLTGVRKSELLQAKWENIDFERREWRIPTTKSGRPHVVPLSSQAIEVLRSIPRQLANRHVFPGRKPGQHLVNIDKRWRKIRLVAGLEDVRLHDLRRTVGSMMAESGQSLLVIQKTLNHATPAPTLVYARLSEDPVREALEDHAVRLMKISRTKHAERIVDFPS